MAATISTVCWDSVCCAAAAAPAKAPRTLLGMPMSLSACSTAARPCSSDTPSARLNDSVLDSSPPSCHTLVGTLRSLKVAKADSGTMLAGETDIGCPVDALRSAGLADEPPVVALADVLADAVVADDEFKADVPPAPVPLALPATKVEVLALAAVVLTRLAGTYTSRRATGDCALRGAHSITTAYWFKSAYMVATWRWPKAL